MISHLQRLLLILCACAAAVAQGETVSLNPSADTCLFELDPAFNFGGQRDMPSGTLGGQVGATRSRALYRFDIAEALPAGAVITAARLKIDVVQSPSGRQNSTFGLYRVLADWGEGDKRGDNPGGATADVGEATWESRFHPDQSWAAPGGAFGSDFASEPAAERTILGDGSYVFEFNEVGLSDIRAAIAEPDSNFGWLLASQSEEKAKTARRWTTREHRTTPPVLEMEFDLTPPPVSDLPELSLTGLPDSPVVRFAAESGVTYEVFRSIDLSNWKLLAVLPNLETDQIAEIPDPEVVPVTGAYYRVSISDSSGVN
ncbi:MAG: DNRLRE domain-containing protein [Verrucomicrobiae bacterium]|nr:DNRLRE domain-containing protein [Verrucomicrobiae bacterium]